MTTQIHVRHQSRDGEVLTAISGLPRQDQYLTREELLDLARKIQQKAIDAQRKASDPLRHEATPGFIEYPDQYWDEACSLEVVK